jgi:LuxR family maltose regulon positive regulatory protein
MELEQLRFPLAKRLAREALSIAGTLPRPPRALTAMPSILIAQILYEQGSLEEAHWLARGCLPTVHQAGVPDCALRAYLVMVRIAIHRGQHEMATSLLQQVERLGEKRGWARLIAMSLCERVDLLLQRGKRDEAQLAAEQLRRLAAGHASSSGETESDVQIYCRTVDARLGDLRTAIARWQLLHQEALARRDLYSAAGIAVKWANALDFIGQQQEAERLFLRTLRLACFAGLRQIFREGVREAQTLLSRTYELVRRPGSGSQDLLPYIGSLLALETAPRKRPTDFAHGLRQNNGLSLRECDILSLVGRGLSNKRIALALTIAPETVKSHIKSIFVKLQVRTRAEAVSRASVLGLLRQ